MKILFHLGHPAHFHLFKNTIKNLINDGNKIFIIIQKKDVLEDLLINEGFEYKNILPNGRKESKISIALGLAKQEFHILRFCSKVKPDLLVGTSVPICHVGKILRIPSINVNEDDANIIPLHSKLAYPFADTILSPTCCNNLKWNNKTIKYPGYHELAYLHPNNFNPDITICNKYINTDKPYIILRFSSLNAHHDKGISGINDEIAFRLIEILRKFGNIYITSERALTGKLEKYRLNIAPIHMHHILAYAKMYIGDSQTMAAESAVLGIPFIRFNDFVGKIGYLKELEDKYELGYGFRSKDLDKMLVKVKELLLDSNLEKNWNKKRDRMLSEKINVSSFLSWFISNFPNSKLIILKNPDYINKFHS